MPLLVFLSLATALGGEPAPPAEYTYDRIPTFDHVEEVKRAGKVPTHWKNPSHDDVLYLVPPPPDPEDAARGAKLLSANGERLVLKVGERARLAPAAVAEGWRIFGVELEHGVLRPLPEAPRVLYARCPGEAVVVLMRNGPDDQSPAGAGNRLRGGTRERYNTRVIVIADASHEVSPLCKKGLDPPRVRNPGRIHGGYFLKATVVMHVGEEVILDPGNVCRMSWEAIHPSVPPGVLEYESSTAAGLHFRAKRLGRTELHLLHPVDCPGYGATARMVFLVE